MKPLIISFSGGKTSGYMAKYLVDKYKDRQIITLFANTGEEREETLDFVNQCDKEFNLNVVWLEAKVTYQEGVGTSFNMVNYEKASRDGKPFEDVIKKYGIPNVSFMFCTRELKQQPIKAYLRSIGLKHNDYEMAIGIRADEFHRINRETAKKHCLIYPLADIGVDKTDVNSWWDKQSFTLNLKEHQGNCKWCYKKSHAKHAMLVKEDVSIYDFPRRMEQMYQSEDKRVIFRGNRNTDQHIEYVKTLTIQSDSQLDFGFCKESCEAFTE